MKEISKVDLGSIKIHKKVLAEITYSALRDVEGVVMTSKNFLDNLGEMLGIIEHPGISISLDKNGQVVIDVKISVVYGINIPEIARHAQDAIRQAIERTVDIDLKDVNVNVQGIERRDT